MNEKIRLDIIGLSTSQTQSGAYALILGETEGNRRLPIIIGSFEAQAIAFELERLRPNRPLTHDLIRSIADEFDIQLKEVIISKFQDGVFFSLLVCSKDKQERKIDSRTSDAVALALRFHCPIYCLEGVLEKAGIVMEESEEDEQTPLEESGADSNEQGELHSASLEELQEMLDAAVANEEYERASKIRDELMRREKND
jgi:uncharacterized protein